MGGRRGGNLGNLVGSGGAVSAAKSSLTRAVGAGDAQAIAAASARLVAASDVGLDALRYGLKLAPRLAQHASEWASLAPPDRVERVRRAWSELKKAESIRASPELDSAVIAAATEAFRRGGGR